MLFIIEKGIKVNVIYFTMLKYDVDIFQAYKNSTSCEINDRSVFARKKLCWQRDRTVTLLTWVHW